MTRVSKVNLGDANVDLMQEVYAASLLLIIVVEEALRFIIHQGLVLIAIATEDEFSF